MDSNLDKIALDLYGKIQTRFPNIQMGDENAAVLSRRADIPKARFFEFEYEEGGEPLGTIAITLDADDGIVLQVSGDLVNDNDNTTNHGAYKFIRSFRQFAKDRLLNFDVQNIGKSNMQKRDYEFQAKPKEQPMQPMMENKMYGNNKMSYQDLGENARLVVKHNAPVNLELPAGRTMHIESIYIENAHGERFKYPFKHLNGARALAEHIKAGGNPYDGIGKHICSLSEELASLRKFKGYVGRQEQLSEAMTDITSVVMERIDSIKKEIHSLQRPAYYQSFAESFQEREQKSIPEAVMNDWIDRLTIRTFNEELTSVFPYIYNLVDESMVPVKEVSADDMLSELSKDTLSNYSDKADMDIVKKHRNRSGQSDAGDDEAVSKTDKHIDKRMKGIDRAVSRLNKESLDPELAFENFMDSLMAEGQDELFSPNKDAQQTAIEKLNKIMSQELKGGPEGTNAIQSLTGIIDNPEFLESLKDVDPDLDVRPLIQQFVTTNAPEIASQLNFGGEEGGQSEPEAAPAAAPMPAPAPMPPEAAPAAPVAEAKDTVEKDDEGNVKSWKHEGDWKKADKKQPRGKVTNASGQALKKSIELAKKAGATLETELDFGNGTKTLAEIIEECGMTPQDVGFEQEDPLQSMLKYVSGFWNREEKNFPLGGERVKIKVQKEFEDGQFGNADPRALSQILAFIDKKDPGSSHGQQHDILRLAGVPGQERGMDEGPEDAQMAKLNDLMAQFSAMKGMPNARTTNTQTGSINGQDASYDDAMNKFKQMKIKFGDDEIDFSNPDQAGDKIKGMMGGMMKGVQGQVPNQNIQFPGGQMNPADMMKDIMGKINFGK